MESAGVQERRGLYGFLGELDTCRRILTVEIRDLEIGPWRVSSSFLKARVKSGQSSSTFLNFRNRKKRGPTANFLVKYTKQGTNNALA